MRPVNLLPARYRPRTGGSGDPRTAYFALGVLGLLVLAILGYVVTANQVSSRNSEIAEVKQQIAAAEAQAVTLQDYGNFAAIKQTRLAAVKSLAVARIDWERLFREMAHVLPSGVWLTSFESQTSSPADGGGDLGSILMLKGCAASHEQIADVMVRLRELHVAAEIELSETAAPAEEETGAAAAAAASTSDSEDCGRYYSFTLEVTMQASSAAAAEGGAVPARLGGGE